MSRVSWPIAFVLKKKQARRPATFDLGMINAIAERRAKSVAHVFRGRRLKVREVHEAAQAVGGCITGRCLRLLRQSLETI